MAETWLENGSFKAEIDSGNLRLSGGDLLQGRKLSVDYDTVATDTDGIFWYYGNGSSPRVDYFYMDCYFDGAREVLRVINATTQNANIYDTAGWRAGSSQKYKGNIRTLIEKDLENLLTAFRNNDVKIFNRKDAPNIDEVGVIAEEADSLITGGDTQSIAPIKYCGYLHSIIKAMDVEYTKQVEDLQSQITDLQAQIDELKKAKA